MIHAYEILSHKKLKDTVYEMTLKRRPSDTLLPGMFFNVTFPNNDFMLHRPVSISDVTEQAFSLTYEVTGKGTKHMSELTDTHITLMGPLGTPLNVVETDNPILIVGEGISIARLLFMSKELFKTNKQLIIVYIGLKEDLIYEETFQSLGDVHVISKEKSIEDIISYINTIIKAHDVEYVYASAHDTLLERLDKTLQGTIKGSLLLQVRMACGFGVCMGCVKKTVDGYIRVCKEGPSVQLGELFYES